MKRISLSSFGDIYSEKRKKNFQKCFPVFKNGQKKCPKSNMGV
jgi:hypothetical protein